jgi:endonuclease-3 related protein
MSDTSNQPIIKVFEVLYSAYGPQKWWPGDSQLEIILGAILTQGTAWHNVTLAIANLKREGLLDPGALLAAKPEHVKALIAPTGFFNVKYDRLKSILEYLMRHKMDFERFRLPIADLRNELLQINGIGPETADSILLYAFDRPVFIVDTYTRRLFSRLGYGWMEKAPYEDVQKFFMQELPSDSGLYNEFHALIVAHCKSICKKSPLCSDCDLFFCAARRSFL